MNFDFSLDMFFTFCALILFYLSIKLDNKMKGWVEYTTAYPFTFFKI